MLYKCGTLVSAILYKYGTLVSAISECNFYCTLRNDIARGASCGECNIIFQSAIKKIDIALTKVPYLFCYMPTAHSNIKIKNLENYENVNIIDMFLPYPGFTTNHWVILISKHEYIFCVNSVI